MVLMLTLLTYEPIGNLNRNPHNFSVLERQEYAAVVLLLAVVFCVITAHLILGSSGKRSFAHPFMNDSADGELVFATGLIDNLVITQNGGHVNVYTGNISIFVPAPVAQGLIFQKGDTISVYGVVQTYHGKKEIIVNSAEDISLFHGTIEN
jgi:hypothetical protein